MIPNSVIIQGKENQNVQEQPVLNTRSSDEIPLELQLFMWECIDQLHEERDYLQVFKLEAFDEMQRITHTSENPEYKMEYLIASDTPITAKVYVIDDGDHSTMLLANEY